MKLRTLLISMGIGAGLMYFFDPQHGERRRMTVRDTANRFVNTLDDSIDMAVQDARNRARGVLSEMTARLSDEEAPDWVLEERVRANLGRISRRTRPITVTADGGRVTLSGPILREEEESVVKVAKRTRGVHAVENQLQGFDSPESIPPFQSEPSVRRQPRTDWGQGNWSPATR